MHISNFTGHTIRLGEYPHCIDVGSLIDTHSSYGVRATIYSRGLSDPPRIMVIHDAVTKGIIHILVLRWEEQFDKQDPNIKNGEVIFDSGWNEEGGGEES